MAPVPGIRATGDADIGVADSMDAPDTTDAASMAGRATTVAAMAIGADMPTEVDLLVAMPEAESGAAAVSMAEEQSAVGAASTVEADSMAVVEGTAATGNC